MILVQLLNVLEYYLDIRQVDFGAGSNEGCWHVYREGGEGEGVAEEDKGPREMTLDEWKAMQKESKMKAAFKLRKAGEGVDLSQWKKGVAYTKKKEEEDEDDEDEEDEVSVLAEKYP